MPAFQDLRDIYRQAVHWEKELSDLYDVAEIGLKRPESKALIRELVNEHKEKLQILEKVKIDDFGHTEWVKYPPQFDEDEMVPKRGMAKQTSPEEILQLILGFQNRQQTFYQALHDKLVASGLKDLFASLVTFKRNQADGIRNLMERHASAEERLPYPRLNPRSIPISTRW